MDLVLAPIADTMSADRTPKTTQDLTAGVRQILGKRTLTCPGTTTAPVGQPTANLARSPVERKIRDGVPGPGIQKHVVGKWALTKDLSYTL